MEERLKANGLKVEGLNFERRVPGLPARMNIIGSGNNFQYRIEASEQSEKYEIIQTTITGPLDSLKQHTQVFKTIQQYITEVTKKGE